MVAADKAPWVAAFRIIHQRIAAVLAYVIEGFDAAILLAHHQNFFATHWFHLPIAGLGQFLAAKSVPGGVQLQGHPADFQAPEETESEPAYDGSRLVPALNMIRPHFETDDEFYNFLDKVAQMFVANPAMFKNMAL